jgi:hypothetical protein
MPGGDPVSAACERPLELGTLVDTLFGEVVAPDEDRVEEHLLECDECSGRLRALVALGDGVRRLAREGAVPVVVTPSFLETAAHEGLRAREYRVAPGERVACTVTREDDLLVSRLRADFTGVSRVDVVTELVGRGEHRIEDVPVSPDALELIVAQAMPAMRALGRSVTRVRLLARDHEDERVLGEYTFDHTPT